MIRTSGLSPLRAAAGAALVAAILAMSGCPTPIGNSLASRVTDKAAPVVTLLSPIGNSAYTQTVVVQGKQDKTGMLKSLGYTVNGTLGVLATGSVPLSAIGADGSFSFQFDTLAFNGPISITVIAKDWNDNVGQAAITLATPGASISSMVVAAGSKSVHVSWEAVANATGYTLYWATGSSAPTTNSPGQVTLSAGTTSYDLLNIPNATLHTFLLKAATPATNYWSGFVKALPLSSLTLAPRVSGEYGDISLEWSAVDGVSDFEIYRSQDSIAGPYENLAGAVTATSWTDRTVMDGHWYYYRIRANIDGAPQSAANGAQTEPIPAFQDRVASALLPVMASRVRTYSSLGTTTAYVASGAAGVAVVNASDPKNPVWIRTVTDHLTDARDLEVATIGLVPYLFVADGAGGLRAFSLANPTSPTFVGTLAGIDARQVSLVQTSLRAYAIDATGGSRIVSINISDPSSMALMGAGYSNANYDFDLGDLQAVYYSGAVSSGYDYVYFTGKNLAQSSRGEVLETYIYKVDNSWPYMGPHFDANYDFKKVTVSGSYIYALGNYKYVLEPPPGYALFVLNRYGLSQAGKSADLAGYPAEIKVQGSKAYSVDSIGVQSWDVTNPASPLNLENLNTQGSPTGIDVSSSTLFLASGINLLQTMDLTVPTALSTTASLATYPASGIAVRGRYGYATTGSGVGSVLRVYDLINPEAGIGFLPSVAVSPAIAHANKVAVSGDYAFVTTSAGKLQIVDISNPLAPTLAGTGNSPSGSLNGLVIRGDYAYCAGSLGFQVFDVSNPSAPILPALLDSEGLSMQDVAIRGNRAYVTDGAYFQANFLKIIDISNPQNPVLLAKALTSANIIGGVELSGKWAFVTDGMPGSGLWAVDIDEASPTYLTDYGPADTEAAGNSAAGELTVAGSWAFAFDNSSGLVVLNASNPVAFGTTPPATNAGFIVKTAPIGTSGLSDQALYGRYLVTTDTTLGIKVVKLY